MRGVRSLIWRLGNLVRPSRTEREMGDELTFHIQSRADDLVRRGLSSRDAERQARLDFGGIERYKEQCRDTRSVPVFENALRDLIYAWRSLRRSPVLVLVTTLSLGLGIGVNTTLLGALSAIFLRVPTMTDSAGVVGVEPGNSNQFSFLNYRDLRDSQIFAEVVGSRVTILNLRSRDNVERVNGLAVTANFFDGLGVGAGMGRVFTRDEARPERDPRLAVLSYACWQRRFGGDPAVLGQALNLPAPRWPPPAPVGIATWRHRSVSTSASHPASSGDMRASAFSRCAGSASLWSAAAPSVNRAFSSSPSSWPGRFFESERSKCPNRCRGGRPLIPASATATAPSSFAAVAARPAEGLHGPRVSLAGHSRRRPEVPRLFQAPVAPPTSAPPPAPLPEARLRLRGVGPDRNREAKGGKFPDERVSEIIRNGGHGTMRLLSWEKYFRRDISKEQADQLIHELTEYLKKHQAN